MLECISIPNNFPASSPTFAGCLLTHVEREHSSLFLVVLSIFLGKGGRIALVLRNENNILLYGYLLIYFWGQQGKWVYLKRDGREDRCEKNSGNSCGGNTGRVPLGVWGLRGRQRQRPREQETGRELELRVEDRYHFCLLGNKESARLTTVSTHFLYPFSRATPWFSHERPARVAENPR